MDIVGTRGFKGDKTISARPQFNQLLKEVDDEDTQETEQDEEMAKDSAEDRLGDILRLDHGE
jgi:hypothetical protein